MAWAVTAAGIGNYATGDHVNLAQAVGLRTVQVGSDWKIVMVAENGADRAYLNGVWTSESAAQDAVRKLVDAIDPSTY
jgi:hypothetical protein